MPPSPGRPHHLWAGACGAALVVAAVLARQSWLDRHFLPSFFVPRHWYVAIETAARVAIAAAGAAMVLARTRLARLTADARWSALPIVAAAILALGASELTLRWIGLRPTEWLVPTEEPRRRDDATLGWVPAPARVGRSVIGGRTIEYVIDSSGYRVRELTTPVDPSLETVVMIGESVMFGEGLTWNESIPAQTGSRLGIQSANLAVHGYSTDQMYLRLDRELPRFRHPAAVVAIFMTELFGRNLDDDRPHLAPGLQWMPPQRSGRLASLAALLVPYRRDATIEEGIRMTREVLHAIVGAARQRGATPLVVVPQFGSEDGAERALRARIIDSGIPHVIVPLDPGWRLAWDRHPNAHAAHVIANAIAAELSPHS